MRLRADRALKRRAEALVRQKAYEKLSGADRRAALDAKLGKGLGAVKQRARLASKS